MGEPQEIATMEGPVHAIVQPPGSKSLTNRALLCAAVAEGCSVLIDPLDSDDTKVMIESLRRLGIPIDWRDPSHLEVSGGYGRFPESSAELFVGNSGTTIRFLTAALGIAGGNYRLDGIPRMRERPIGDLVNALNSLGGQLTTESPNGCPPVTIDSPRIQSGQAQVRGNISSQYLSGLLMAAPLAARDLQLQVAGELVSLPYVEMTLAVMKEFGVEVEVTPPSSNAGSSMPDPTTHSFRISAGQRYVGREYQIEPDASAASYFWAAPAICGGRVEVTGLNRNSLQGDIRFVEVLAQMGCIVEYGEQSISVTGPARKGVDVNMSDISDTVQTLSAIALFVEGPTTVRGIAHNRVKETDRIGNLAIELRKLGAMVDEFDDGMRIAPGSETRPASIETYDDHRMAMSLALAGLRQPGVVIQNPNCVAKTYPNYFEDLNKLRSAPP